MLALLFALFVLFALVLTVYFKTLTRDDFTPDIEDIPSPEEMKMESIERTLKLNAKESTYGNN